MKKSFTLIELLVVIAIIAIMAGMMMPALGKARESGKTASCTGNLRQLAESVHLYSGTYDDFLPSATGGWCCNRGTWIGKNVNQRRVDLRTTGFAVDSKNPAAKSCPSVLADALAQLGPQTGDDSATSASVGTCRGGGYGMNINLGFRDSNYQPVRLRAGGVYNAARAVMISDTALEWSAGLTVFPYYLAPRTSVAAANCGTQTSWSATQQFRHNGRAAVAWIDGHVSAERPGEFDTGDFALANNIGWMGKNDAVYCLTKDDFIELGLTPGAY
ncbi:MAG: prepilin-type N-terminal cleavage/methylation domain-containing protein [Lentisphaeria bacterium]|nr:prepilin-type N-terminal cleavage/methylation domain-containing protein [Lentisphaeria bacterium]